MEKTRSSQQSQIQSLQTQVQSLETTVETLGQFLLQYFDKNPNLELPGDVRRIVQQIGNLEHHRKKPIFVERKIGKSMSVSAQLGYPLKVLEELNETMEKENTPTLSTVGRTKSQFFENTYQQLRKQNRMRPNQLDPREESLDGTMNHLRRTSAPASEEAGENAMQSNITSTKSASEHSLLVDPSKSPSNDSGIATPMTPTKHSDESTSPACSTSSVESHPFGNCEDVNFKFNGTTQLKSLRPLHLRSALAPTTGTDKHIDGRS